MQVPEIAHSVANLVADALPALLRTPEPSAEGEVERITGSNWPRVSLVWESVVSILSTSVLEGLQQYLLRGQPVMVRQILTDRLREALYSNEEKARELDQLLTTPLETLERRYLRRKGPKPLAAYYLKITLQSMRCFGEAQTLDLRDGQGRPARWTVILGENGVGKTTLLQALAALSPVEDPLGIGSVAPEQTVTRYAGDVVLREWAGSGLQRYGSITPMYLSAEIAVGAKLGTPSSFETVSWAVQGDNGLGIFGQEEYAKIGGLAVFGYGAARRMGDAALGSGGSKRNTVFTLFYEQGTLLNAEEWLLQTDYAAARRGSKSSEARQLEEVRQLLLRVLPDVTDLRMQVGEGGKAARVELLTSYGWVGLKQMSLGYRTLVAWMVDLASGLYERHPDSADPLSGQAVVLVDEVDLHLHPSWQRDLINLIGDVFPNVQFVVTSHSPLVVQGAEDVNLALLRRVGDHVIIDNDVDAVRRWRVDQILTSELFGLETARPPYLDAKLERRRELLLKSQLSAEESRELEDLEAEAASLPTAERPEDIEAMEIIRQAAEELRDRHR